MRYVRAPAGALAVLVGCLPPARAANGAVLDALAEGERLLGGGEAGGAAAEFERALAAQPGSPTVRRTVFEALKRAGFPRRAAELQLGFLRQEPDAAPIRWSIAAESFLEAEDPVAAQNLLGEALERFPDSALLHGTLGRTIAEQGRFEQALVAHEKAVALDPGGAEARLQRSRTLLWAARFDEGLADFERCWPLLDEKGRERPVVLACQSLLGRFREARETLGRGGVGRLLEAARTDEAVAGAETDVLDLQVRLEAELREALQAGAGEGEGEPVGQRLARLSGTMADEFRRVSAAELRRHAEDHPDEVLRLLEERELTMISVAKSDGGEALAQRLHQRLTRGTELRWVERQFAEEEAVHFGARSWMPRGDLVEPLRESVFAVDVGGVSPLIEGADHWFVVCVHDRREAAGTRLDQATRDRLAREGVVRERRRAWEAWYLVQLRARLAAGNTD